MKVDLWQSLEKNLKKNIPVYYFSRTGNSKKIALLIGKKIKAPVKEIKAPKLPYIFWLFLSFFPFLPLKAKFDLPEKGQEEIVLCFPKWTFNCPPVTYFLLKCPCKKLTMIITYGGWGKDHYEKIYKFLCTILRKKVKFYFVKKSELVSINWR